MQPSILKIPYLKESDIPFWFSTISAAILNLSLLKCSKYMDTNFHAMEFQFGIWY